MALKLDIGGTIFKTSRSTLTKYDCMFRGLLESGIPLETDDSGCVFIDRDPTHFRYILNFMRDGTVELPRDLKEIQEILKEAEYYSIQELVDLCKNSQYQEPQEYRLAESNADLNRILIEATRDVLVLVYPSCLIGGLHLNYAGIKRLVQKYSHKVDIVLVENRETQHKNWFYMYQRFDGSEKPEQPVHHYQQMLQKLENLCEE